MIREHSEAPELREGVLGWKLRGTTAEVLFLGNGTPADRTQPLPEAWLGSEIERARLKQVHGDRVHEGAPGWCGEGDGLVTDRARLALEIATADCVPVLFASRSRVAAAHAGWRGIVAGIVARTAERLDADETLEAFVGPSIGACCYEVDDEVARAVVASAPRSEVVAGTSRRGRPRLDLVAAVVAQLAGAGIEQIAVVRACTRCHPEWLASYRRDGPDAGRNLSLIWR